MRTLILAMLLFSIFLSSCDDDDSGITYLAIEGDGCLDDSTIRNGSCYCPEDTHKRLGRQPQLGDRIPYGRCFPLQDSVYYGSIPDSCRCSYLLKPSLDRHLILTFQNNEDLTDYLVCGIGVVDQTGAFFVRYAFSLVTNADRPNYFLDPTGNYFEPYYIYPNGQTPCDPEYVTQIYGKFNPEKTELDIKFRYFADFWEKEPFDSCEFRLVNY